MNFFIAIYFKEQLIRRGGLQLRLYNYKNAKCENSLPAFGGASALIGWL